MRSHDELLELSGAYALDAVDEDEKTEIEAHLSECDICRKEISNFRELAGGLALSVEPAPDELWNRIATELKPRGNIAPLKLAHRKDAPSRMYMVLAAAAAVVVVAILSTALISQHNQVNDLKQALSRTTTRIEADSAAQRPGARKVELTSADQKTSATMVVTTDNVAYLLADKLPTLPSNETYQVWSVVNGNKVSVGLLGSAPAVSEMRIPPNSVAVALTVEDIHGVVSSKNQPIVSGAMA